MQGTIAAALAHRRTTCSKCQLPLARGPNGQLYSVKRAAELWKDASTAAPKPARRGPWAEWVMARLHSQDQRIRRLTIALASVPVLAMLCSAALLLATLFDNSPEARIRRFTQTCLAGEWDAASAYLEDDAVQRVEFERWRSRHLASILDKHRPPGDRVSVEVDLVRDRDHARMFHVTLRSKHLGNRSHIQHWRPYESGWMFDALATLRHEDGPMPAPATANRGKSGSAARR